MGKKPRFNDLWICSDFKRLECGALLLSGQQQTKIWLTAYTAIAGGVTCVASALSAEVMGTVTADFRPIGSQRSMIYYSVKLLISRLEWRSTIIVVGIVTIRSCRQDV